MLIIYSNGFDLIRRILLLIFTFALTLLVIGVLDRPYKAVWDHFPESSGMWWVFAVTNVIWQFGLLIVVAWLLASRVLTNTFHSYLYIRLWLFTPVTVREARDLAPLFSLGEGGKWYPCTDVRKLPREQRKAFLYAVLERYSQRVAV